jgi:hypothetical protein
MRKRRQDTKRKKTYALYVLRTCRLLWLCLPRRPAGGRPPGAFLSIGYLQRCIGSTRNQSCSIQASVEHIAASLHLRFSQIRVFPDRPVQDR